jgi:uncharacterized protein YcbK (DUF882 family)
MALTIEQRQYFDRVFPSNFSLQEMVEGSRGRSLVTIRPHVAAFWESLTFEQAQSLCVLAWRIQREVRDVLKIPIFVSNAYRPDWYEESKKRNPNGQHPQGRAADISCANNQKLTRHALSTWKGGVGVYSWGIHLDNGPNRRW